MSQLATLREQLGSLRRRRQGIRLGTALVALVVALLWTLAVIFLLDWQLSMSRPQRLLAILFGAGVMIWAYLKYAQPFLGTRETELDVALMVERQQQIDSDLVAALQFESPEASKWGSTQLEGAVISYVSEFSRGCNLLEGFSAEQFVRRGLALILTLVVVIGAVLWQPRYAATFLNRLAMGSRHYPTRTSIDQLTVNGTVVASDGQIVRSGYGQPVEFAVQVSGEMPIDVRRIELTSVASGVSRPIELTSLKPKIRMSSAAESSAAESSAANSAASDPSILYFRAQLPELVDSLQFQVFAGDAWTDPAHLEVIPLPEIQPTLTPTPPAYARQSIATNDEPAGSRQLSVLEGSRVDLELECLNKRLTAATLIVDKKSYPLAARDSDGRRWALPAAGSPLARIDEATKYQIQVTDEDGLHLPHPMEGYIRIKIDRPPTITASVDVQYFLPNSGLPEIRYTVNDDYGISAIRALVEIQHDASQHDSTQHDSTQPDAAPPDAAPPDAGAVAVSAPQTLDVLPIAADKPLVPPKIPSTGIYHLPLSTLNLVKGDQVKVTLLATDYRGDQPGKTTKCEPLVLQITDESGIMAALGETDLRAAHQMDVLIQRQTQTGGLK
ncbi:MAG TPA: hypothetical protein VHX65_03665 [Pirellulales bacterium]|nr:hypothetical protein [Pirellulales bacterium]